MSSALEFDRTLENRIRLQIMSILMVHTKVEYNYLKQKLDLSDGNLASNIKVLEKVDYITKIKKFINNKPNTSYSATAIGIDAFNRHLMALEEFLKEHT